MIGKQVMQDFVDAARAIKEYEALIKIQEERKAVAEKKLMEQMTDAGVQRIAVDGVTVYIHKQIFASKAAGISDEQAADALRATGLDDMIKPKFNANTMSAYIRELDGQGLPIPRTLYISDYDEEGQLIPDTERSVISVTTKWSVRMVGDK